MFCAEYYQSRCVSFGKFHLFAIGTDLRKLCGTIFATLPENRPYEAIPPGRF